MGNPNTNWTELISKIVLAVLTLIIVPTFGWVWMAESRISSLERSLELVNTEVTAARANTTNIQLIQKDIEHINEKLDEIADLLDRNGR